VLPVLWLDVEPGSPPQSLSQPVRRKYRAEPDYTLQGLPPLRTRIWNLLLINLQVTLLVAEWKSPKAALFPVYHPGILISGGIRVQLLIIIRLLVGSVTTIFVAVAVMARLPQMAINLTWQVLCRQPCCCSWWGAESPSGALLGSAKYATLLNINLHEFNFEQRFW